MPHHQATRSESEASERGGFFPALTGMRWWAALAVYVFHFNLFDPRWLGGLAYRMGNELHVGVNLFYVLSGFLIAYRYGHFAESAGSGQPAIAGPQVREDWFAYAWNRVARIVPAYWLLLGLTWWVQGVPDQTTSLVQITLTQGLFPRYFATGIGQAWTLSVEESFYFLAPLLQRVPGRWSLLLLAAVSLACGAAVTAATGNEFLMRVTLVGALPAFVCGMLLARWWRRKTARGARQEVIGRTAVWTYAGAVLVIGVIAVLATVPRQGAGNLVYGLALLVAFPLCVTVLFRGLLTEQSELRRLLETRLLVLLGGCSYVFYLIHMGVVRTWVHQWITPHDLGALAAITLIALAIHLGWEQPLHVLLKDWLAEEGARGRTATQHSQQRLRLAGFLLAGLMLAAWVAAGPAGSQMKSWRLAQRAGARLEAGDASAAQSLVDQALLAWNANPAALQTRAALHLHAGHLADAISDLQRTVHVSPRDPQLHEALATAYAGQANWLAAAASTERSLALRTAQPQAWLRRGMLAGKQGRWSQAADDARVAVGAWPNSPDARALYVEALARSGQRAIAQRECRAWCRRWPADAAAHRWQQALAE